ncbi:FadR/GntR family transcriptional regulator [Xylanimonas protaetiae]|uniref:FadR family transcriptional regulator n=1 Tax=Xylanimonas protaetiae TaxID=2509457 RepID=A0A4P6FCK4_9MICO|nr:FCD domain-containing protein [Xylanimonas protaetiae]QAY71277.1 FadR family transcriptional regulator [Xylanimonas protaetiae]
MNTSSGSDRARRAFAYLRRRITSGEWPVGSRIPVETELMELLGVGKMTVREAVRSLASMGMLETLPGRGTYVRARTPVAAVLAESVHDYELAEVLAYRRGLEVEAARLAARHRTDDHVARLRAAHEANDRLGAGAPAEREQGRTPQEFHALVFEATGTRLLPDAYAGVLAALRKVISLGVVIYASGEESRRHDHGQILAAIEAGDAERAALLMAQHVADDLEIAGPGR